MSETKYDRRAFMAYFSSIGLGSTLMPGVLWGQIQGNQQQQGPEITKEMIASAEQIAGLSFSDEERTQMVRSLTSQRADIQRLHKEPIDMSMPPAIVFDPVPPGKELAKKTKAPMVRSKVPVMARPGSLEELAYHTVAELSELVRTRKVKPSELTDMYIGRLKKYDDKLHFFVNLTEDRAKKQAADADSEIARGKYRGPLHGIPWGAKDLLAVKGTPTTWGAGLYQNQMFDYNATVVNRLDEAGAILIAKLTLGSLAQGDRWWKERTRNPWNPETRARAARPPAQARRRPRAVSVSASALRRTARSSRRRARTASPVSVRRSDASHAPARWRCRGRPTSSAPCAAALKIARWCSTRSRDRMVWIAR